VQPVTIKTDCYFNTRWLSQGVMGFMLLLLLWYGWQYHVGYLLGCPVVLGMIYSNHNKILADRQLTLKMQANGAWYGIQSTPQGSHQTALKVLASWNHPSTIFLKFRHPQRIIYATIRRAGVGSVEFSHILVGTTVHQAAMNKNNE